MNRHCEGSMTEAIFLIGVLNGFGLMINRLPRLFIKSLAMTLTDKQIASCLAMTGCA